MLFVIQCYRHLKLYVIVNKVIIKVQGIIHLLLQALIGNPLTTLKFHPIRRRCLASSEKGEEFLFCNNDWSQYRKG